LFTGKFFFSEGKIAGERGEKKQEMGITGKAGEQGAERRGNGEKKNKDVKIRRGGGQGAERQGNGEKKKQEMGSKG
jgi:hypothetical protein